jgi:uncharacterized protein (DUF2336 family)
LTLAQLAQALTELAKLRSPEDREQLLGALISLIESPTVAGALKSDQILTLIDDIVVPLVTQADPSTRARLSARLAAKDWPPVALVVGLSKDDLAIAQPIIAASPVLSDDDLLDILAGTTLDHHIAVASRSSLTDAVIKAIMEQADALVLTALASNYDLTPSRPELFNLVQASRRLVSLRAPLARHPRLTAPMAEMMLAWVGSSLQSSLIKRFHLSGKAQPNASEQSEMDQRLADKLMASGNLHPSAVLRALREDQPSLFMAALARLSDIDLVAVRRMVEAPTPDLLALACLAIGLDRCTFSPLLAHVRRLWGDRPGGDGRYAANRAFDNLSPTQAKAALKWALNAARV